MPPPPATPPAKVADLETLCSAMPTSGYASLIPERVLKFNGGLLATPVAVPLTDGQISLLLEAARADWREVEPAIFGTLLERALHPDERARLGAHYTPRAYDRALMYWQHSLLGQVNATTPKALGQGILHGTFPI